MANENSIRRYRNWYAKLLRFYPRTFRKRFAEGMEQTFNDLCQERKEAGQGLLTLAFCTFVDTSTAIMIERMKMFMKPDKNIIRIALVTALLLMIPLVAMQFTNEVVWKLGDFIVAGALLFGAGLTYELIARKMGSNTYKPAIGLAVATGLILVWANLAVGLIGSEDNPANLLYGAVLAVGIIGAFIARFKPSGMARTLFATAFTQALVPLFALIIWQPNLHFEEALPGMIGVLVINAFFVMLFVGSALLFRRASARET